jgi:hypothetical protein
VDYAGVLRVAAVAGLLVEAAILVVRIWSGRSGPAAAAVAFGCLLGPLTAPAAGLWAVVSIGQDREGRSLHLAGLFAHAAVLEILALVLLVSLPGGWPNSSVVVLAALAGAWAVRSYRRTTSPLRRRRKALLLAIRLGAIFLLAAWLTHPRLEYYHDQEIRRTVLVGIDVSKSMGRADMPPVYRMGQVPEETNLVSRIAAVRQALADQAGALDALAEKADLRVFTFGPTASPSAPMTGQAGRRILESLSARAEATALGDAALAAVAEQDQLGRELAGLVLITDGNQNLAELAGPERLGEQLSLRSVPLYAVAAGWNEVTASTKSLRVEQLQAPEVVDAFNRLAITARLETMGLAGREVEVRCRFGEQVVDTRRIPIGRDRQQVELQFSHVPLQVGYHRLQIEAELLGSRPRNLQPTQPPSRLVQVVDREIRVLYLEGRIRYETKFITQAIAAGRRFSIDRRVLTGRNWGRGPVRLGDEMDDWLSYHAIVLGSVEPRMFSAEQLGILRRLVDEKGKGLAMIGGQKSFGAGGWGQSPLAAVLPLDWSESTGQIESSVQILPTPAGMQSDLMRIAPDQEVGQGWARLGPLPGANRIAARSGGRVLARDARGNAMIISGRFGSGRSLAIAFDETWRWVLTPRDTQALQKRFWRQVALHLADPRGNVWITTDQPGYDLRVLQTTTRTRSITAGVEDAAGRPVADPETLQVTLTDPGDNVQQIELVRANDVFQGQLPAIDGAGTYRLEIRATVGGREMAAQHQFEVFRRDLEGRDVLADYDLLRRLAGRTRGKFVPLRDLDEALEALDVEASPLVRRVFKPVDLWRRWAWPVALAVMALLMTEWTLRRKQGLV